MDTFFIVGAQKSGTTWLQRILNSIPQVGCFGESHLADSLLPSIVKSARSYNNVLDMVEQRVYDGKGHYKPIESSEIAEIIRALFLARIKGAAGDRWDNLAIAGDKTPAHSFHMQTLRALYPNTRFIHMLRDGRDVVVSNYYHRARVLRQLGRVNELRPLPQEAPGLFLKWISFTSAILAGQRNGINVHTIRYEDMLANPSAETRKAIDYILPKNNIDDEQLLNAIAFNSFSSLSGGRKPGQVDEDSFVRRGTSGNWKEELTDSEIKSWNPEGLKLLQSLGYR